MRNWKIVVTTLLCSALGLLWVCYSGTQGNAQEEVKYVGTQTCATCHPDVVKKWQLTVHRATLFNKDDAKKGCESCHGPGGAHVEGGGDVTKIVRFDNLKPNQITSICQKCHNQERVTLWKSSLHSRTKMSCITCHDPHSLEAPDLLKTVENGKLALEALTSSIEQTQLQVNTLAAGSEPRKQAEEQLARLQAEEKAKRDELKGAETAYKRVAEPYLCYNCHKTQQVQGNMASHHPIAENKMTCSGCHNPHGGPNGMLNEESINETCFRCHADKLGPFTFDHPPVTEDCTICHNPHGSVQNNLLVQSQPFLCLKCHAGPHSSSGTLGNAQAIPQYYTECTDCHTQIHGSDQHGALHF